MIYNYPTSAELLSIIAKTEFKPFTKNDWYAFAGCESKEPLIGSYNDFIIVIDGHIINMVHEEDQYGGVLYNLSKGA
jgi:hypothetical protein